MSFKNIRLKLIFTNTFEENPAPNPNELFILSMRADLEFDVLHLLGDGLWLGQRVLLLGLRLLEVVLVELGDGRQAGASSLLHLGKSIYSFQ